MTIKNYIKYTEICFDKPSIWGYIYHHIEPFVNYLQAYICGKLGHKWVDDGSYANGDSGADHMRCTRCGQEFSHTYY